MKKIFCVETLFGLLIVEFMIILPVAIYLLWVQEQTKQSEYVHMSQDVVRNCLRIGGGKAVDGFETRDGKIGCLFKEEKK